MKLKNLFVLVFLSMTLFLPVKSQTLSGKEKKEILEKLLDVINENYVLQDSISIIRKELNKIIKTPKFKEEAEPHQFANYLTVELRNITGDAHFMLRHDQSMFEMVQNINQNGDGLRRPVKKPGTPDSKKNYYFKKLEIFDGNVGYLKLEKIPDIREARLTVDAAMAFLSNSDAVIMDLRGNAGGIGGFIPYLISYFFPQDSILLYTREMNAWDSVSYHYTYKDLPGKRLDDRPVYILIDAFTGSAATNMAYTLQSFDRAIIVGEKTGSGYRGAHSAGIFPLAHGITAAIPIGRVVNAKTKTNWRHEGVLPDVRSSSENALEVAHKLALNELIKTEENKEFVEIQKKALKEIIANKRRDKSGNSTSAITAISKTYSGVYEGNRNVWIIENKLKYQKQGGPPLTLKKKGKHLYEFSLPPNTVPASPLPDIRFNLDEQGTCTGITFIFESGEKENIKKIK